MLKKQKRFNKFDIITELQGQSGKNEIQLEVRKQNISLFSKQDDVYFLVYYYIK